MTLDDFQRLLDHVPPDIGRDEWWRILAAGKAEFGNDAKPLLQEWSAAGANYRECDFESTFRSVSAGGGITIGSAIHLGKEYGFVPGKSATRRTKAERREARRRQHEAQAAEAAVRDKKNAAIADEARRQWSSCEAVVTHPYCEAKQVGYHNVKVDSNNWLVVPMYYQGEVWNVQRITPQPDDNGSWKKRFLKGGRQKGCYHLIGRYDPAQPVGIAEGYSTAAAVFEHQHIPMISTFGAGNLPTVAAEVRRKHPHQKIIIYPDSDEPGIKAAHIAVAQSQCHLSLPPGGTSDDWCDFYLKENK